MGTCLPSFSPGGGYRVPEDVQIIGFDGIHKFGNEDDELFVSSICQPVRQLAEKCVEILLEEDRSALPSLTLLPVKYEYGGNAKYGRRNFFLALLLLCYRLLYTTDIKPLSGTYPVRKPESHMKNREIIKGITGILFLFILAFLAGRFLAQAVDAVISSSVLLPKATGA